MTNLRNGLLLISLCCAFGFGVVVGCEKKGSNPPDDGGSNLCTEYTTCDACIAGQQEKNGVTQGEAETQCGAAVLGCWTTWDKPIVCGGKTHDEKPAS
jgi:hypothetical protein